MAEELEKLIIRIDDELGDLSGIDEAIKALEKMRDFGAGAEKGAKQLEAMGKALQEFNGLGKKLDGLDKVAGGINAMIDALARLGGDSGKVNKTTSAMRDLGKSMDLSRQAKAAQKDIQDVEKELKNLEKATKGTKKTEKISLVDTASLKNQTINIRKALDEQERELNKRSRAYGKKDFAEKKLQGIDANIADLKRRMDSEAQQIQKSWDIVDFSSLKDKAYDLRRTVGASFSEMKNAALDAAKAEKYSSDNLESLMSKRESLAKERSKLMDAYDRETHGEKYYTDSSTQMIKDLREMSSEISAIDAQISRLKNNEKIVVPKMDASQIEEAKEKFRNQFNDLETLFNKYGDIGRKLTEAINSPNANTPEGIKLIEEYEKKLEESKAKIEKLVNDIAETTGQKLEIPTSTITASFKSDEKEIEADNKELERLEKEREKVIAEIAECDKRIKDLESKGEIGYSEDEVARSRELLDRLANDYESVANKIDSTQRTLTENLKNYRESGATDETLGLTIDKQKRDLTKYETELADIVKRIEDLTGKAFEVPRTEESFEYTEVTRDIEADTKKRDELLQKREALNQRLSDIEGMMNGTAPSAGDTIQETADRIVNLGGVLDGVSEKIMQLGMFGDALQKFAGLGDSLKGIADVSVDINKLIDAFERIGGIDKDAFANISSFQLLGEALHSFDGIVQTMDGMDKVIDALERFLGLINKFDDVSDDDFKFIGTIASEFGKFERAATSYQAISIMTSAMAKLIGVLQNGKEIQTGKIQAIAAEFESFNNINNLENINESIFQFTRMLVLLQEANDKSVANVAQLISAFNMAYSGIDNIGSKIPELVKGFENAGKMLGESGLLEELWKFKSLNDSYQHMANFVGGIAQLIDVLQRGASIHPEALWDTMAQLEALGNSFAGNKELEETLKWIGEFSDAMARLINAIKFARVDKKDNPINTIAELMAQFEPLNNNLQGFSYTLTGLVKLINLLDTSVAKKDIDIKPIETLLEAFKEVDGENIGKAGVGIKALGKGLESLNSVDTQKIIDIAPAIQQMTSALGQMGSNNTLKITIRGDGVAEVTDVINHAADSWDSFLEKVNSTAGSIDFADTFKFGETRRELEKQVVEIERSLKKQERVMRESSDKMKKYIDMSQSAKDARETSKFQSAFHDWKMATEYAKQYQTVLAELENRLKEMPSVALRNDAEGMTRLKQLEEEYKKYQDVMQRMLGREGAMRRAELEGYFAGNTDAAALAAEKYEEELGYVAEHMENISAEMEKTKAAFEQMERTAEGVATKTSMIAEAMNDATASLKEMATESGQSFSAFGSLLKNTGTDMGKSFGNLFDAFGKHFGQQSEVGDGIAALAGKLGTIAKWGGRLKLVLDVLKSIMSTMNKVTMTLWNATKSMVQFAKTMLTKVVGAFNAVNGAVKKTVSVVLSGAKLMTSAMSKFGSAVGSVAKQFAKLGSAAKSIGAAIGKIFLKIIPGSGAILKKSGKSLGDIIKKTAIIGTLVKKIGGIIKKLDNLLVRRALMAFINEMKQAFQDLAVYSSKTDDVFNKNVSRIFSALRRSANQWIAAFEPLINAMTPIVLNFLETLRTAGENLAKFMAILTGQNYYLRAKPFYEDYAKGLDKANKSAKNLTNSLDELNILSENKSDDSEIDPADMWEKVYVDGSFNLPKIDIHDILEAIKDFLRNIPWDKIKETLRDWIKKLFDIINEILRDEELWYLIGKTIAEMINTLFEMINEAVHDLDWAALGRAIVNLVKGVLENIDWNLIRDTIKTMFEGLATTLNEIFADKEMWKEIGETIAHIINDVIVNAINSFVWNFKFDEMIDSLLLALKTAMENIQWDEIYRAIEGIAKAIADMINTLFADEKFWEDLANTIANAFNALFFGLEQLADRIDFEKVGKTLAKAISDLLENFDWNQVGKAVLKWAEGLAELINGVLSDPNLFADIGVTIANALNIAIAGLRDFVLNIDADALGKRIGEAVVNAFKNIDWESIFKLPVDILNQIAKAINGFFDRVDFGDLGQILANALKEALKTVNWDDIRKAVERTISNIVNFMNSIFADEELWKEVGKAVGETGMTLIRIPINILWGIDWEKALKDLALGLNEAIKKIDLEDIGQKLGEIVSKMLKGIADFFDTFDFKGLGKKIGKAIANFFDGFSAEDVFNAIYKAFDKLGDLISNMLKEMNDNGTFYNIGQKIAAALTAAIAGLSNFLDDNSGQIKKAIDKLLDGFLSYITKHESYIVKKLNNIIDKICDIIKSVFENKAALFKKFADIIRQLNLGEALGTLIGMAISNFFEKMEINTAVIDGIVKHLWSFFQKIWEVGIAPHIGEAISWLIGKITAVLTGAALGKLIGNALGKAIGEAIGKLIGDLVGKAVASKVGAAIGTAIGGPIGTIIGGILGFVIGEIVSYLVSHLGKIGDVLKNFFKGIGDIIGKIIDVIGGFFGKIGDWFKGLFGKKDKADETSKTDDKKKDKNNKTKTDDKIVVDNENVSALKKVITEAIKDAESIVVTLDDLALKNIQIAFENALSGAGLNGAMSDGTRMNSGNPGVPNPYLNGENEGKNTTSGLLKGLDSEKDKIDRWGIERAEAILKGYRDKMIINSPSEAMYQLGSWTGEGLYNGIKSWIEKLVALIGRLGDAILNAVKGLVDAISGVGDLIGGALSGVGNIFSGAGEGLENLGKKIGDFLSGKKESTSITNAVNDDILNAKKLVEEGIDISTDKFANKLANAYLKAVTEAINKMFAELDYAAIAEKIGEVINKVVSVIDWKKIADNVITSMFAGIDPAKIAEEITDLLDAVIINIDWGRLFDHTLTAILSNVDLSALSSQISGGLRFNADNFDTSEFDRQFTDALADFDKSMATYEDALNDRDLLDIYANWKFAEPLHRAYREILESMENLTTWSLGKMLKKWEDFARRVGNLFKNISREWDRMFRDMQNYTKKGFRKIYNLFKTWIKKIDNLIKNMSDYWKATLEFQGIVKEELDAIEDAFDDFIDDLRPKFRRLTNYWRDAMRKFPAYAKQYLNDTLQAFKKILAKIKEELRKFPAIFEDEFAKLPNIADYYLDKVCEKFKVHIQHWKDYIIELAPFFSGELANLAIIADEYLPLVCAVFDKHMQHIKDKFDDLVAYWEETMKKFPDIAEKWLEKVCATFKKHMNHLKDMFDDLLWYWDMTLGKFPKVVDDNLRDSENKFGIHTGDMVKDIDDVAKKWTDTFGNLTPATTNGVTDAKNAVKDAVAEIKKEIDGVKTKWDDTLKTFPTTADTQLAKTCGEFEKHSGHLNKKLDALKKKFDDTFGTIPNGAVTAIGGLTRDDVTKAIKDASNDVAKKVADAIKDTDAIQCNCNCGNSNNATSGNNAVPTKNDITDAVKAAADDIAKKIADEVKDSNAIQCTCNCNCGDKNEPSKDDIAKAVKDAADDAAQKVIDKINPDGDTPSKDDVAEAIKKAADEVAQKVIDNAKDEGKTPTADDVAEAVKEAADKIAKEVADKTDSENAPSKEEIEKAVKDAADEVAKDVVDKTKKDDTPTKDDITEAIKDAADEVAKEIVDKAKEAGITNEGCNCAEKLQEIAEILKNIADAVNAIRDKMPESSSNEQQQNNNEAANLSNIEKQMKDLIEAVNAIGKKIPEVSNGQQGNNSINLGNIEKSIRDLIDAVNAVRDKIPQNSNAQSGTSTDNGSKLDDIKKAANEAVEILKTIRDKMPQSSNAQGSGNYDDKLTNIATTLGQIADAVKNIKPSEQQQTTTTSDNQNGCNCGDKLDKIYEILGQIADAVKSTNVNEQENAQNNGGQSNQNSSEPIDTKDLDSLVSTTDELCKNVTGNPIFHELEENIEPNLQKVVNNTYAIYQLLKRMADKIGSSKANEELMKKLDALAESIGKLNDTFNGLDFQILTNLIETMKEALRQLKDAVELLKQTLEDTLNKAVTTVQKLLDLGKDIINSITNAVLELKSATDALVKQFKELPSSLKQAAKDLVDAANKVARAITEARSAIDNILRNIGDLARTLDESAKKIAQQVRELIKELNEKNFDTLIGSIEALKNAISGLIKRLENLKLECNCQSVDLNGNNHLDNNTEAKSKNTKAVEDNNKAIGNLKGAIDKLTTSVEKAAANWAYATANAEGGAGGQGGSGGAGGAGGNASINVNLKTIADMLSAIAKEIHNLAEMVKQYGSMLPSTTVAGNTYNIGDLDRNLIEALKEAYTNLNNALNVFDNTAKTVLSDAQKVINAVKIELEKLVSTLTNATTKLEAAAKAVADGLKQLPKELTEAANKLSIGAQNMTKLIVKAVEALNTAASKISTAVDEMTKLIKEISNLNASLTVTVDDGVWKLIEAIDALEAKLDSYKKALKDMMGELSEGVSALATAITGVGQELNNIVTKFAESIDKMYASATKIATAINDATSKLEGASKVLEDGLKDIEKQLKKSFTDLSNAVTNLQKAIEAGQSLITQIGEVIGSTITLAASELSVSAEKLVGAMRTIKNDMDYLYTQLFQILQRTEQTLRNTTANLTGAFYDAANRLEQASEKVSTTLVNTTNAFVNAAKDITAAILSVKAVIEWMVNAVNTLSSNMHKLDEHLEKLTTAIDNLASKIADIKDIQVHVTCDCNCNGCDKNCGNNSNNSNNSSTSNSTSNSSSNSSSSSNTTISGKSETTGASYNAMGGGNASKAKDATEYNNEAIKHASSTDSSDLNKNKSTGNLKTAGVNNASGEVATLEQEKSTMEDFLQSPEAVTKAAPIRFELDAEGGTDVYSTSSLANPATPENLDIIKTRGIKGQDMWYTFDQTALAHYFAAHGFGAGVNASRLISDTMGKPSMVSPEGNAMYTLNKPKYQSLADGMVERIKAKGYQMGGMPNSGELYVARENGTSEMVGRIGSHAAVANANDQIVTAVANGVSMANDSLKNTIENSTTRLEQTINNKDLEVNIGDREIAQANNRGQRKIGRNLMEN